MPSKVTALPIKRGFGETARRDAWWVQPLAVGIGFLLFVVYATWAALQGEYYHSGNLLSPFYSPELWYPAGAPSEHALFGPQPGWWPAFFPYSPAILILWAPGGFRVVDGALEVGVLLAAVLYTKRFFDPMEELAMFYNSYQSAASALEKISGVLEEEPSVPDPVFAGFTSSTNVPLPSGIR